MAHGHWRATATCQRPQRWRATLGLVLLLCAVGPAAARFPGASSRRIARRRLAAVPTAAPTASNFTAAPPSNGKPHPEPSPLQIPPGSTLEDCRNHPGLCQPTACELWRDDIKDRRESKPLKHT